MKKNSVEKNKELCEKYPFLIPRNVWTDEVPEDYDYSYTRLDDYRITQIKEKWGFLHWYSNTNDAIRKVVSKYENMSKHICKHCGKPATKVTMGWISSYCDECADKFAKYEYFADINELYGSDDDGNN